ncbi:hypothetical protein SLEP1_g44541 [Rubroshorea leprosula]|uniref:Uncharacterized protein n=1 Tax=Rubroshorea leprosula TaxID=152421 RepID=A0AAV5L250_9ROSI|nr:hypothetical protein SLEP1_g39962 [Rubroshorea leprosula]GKV36400.1 hypothetical protein SLEP1_g44541 [Rubroshorea leprosula]
MSGGAAEIWAKSGTICYALLLLFGPVKERKMSSGAVSFIRSCQRKWSNGELPTKVQGNRVA